MPSTASLSKESSVLPSVARHFLRLHTGVLQAESARQTDIAQVSGAEQQSAGMKNWHLSRRDKIRKKMALVKILMPLSPQTAGMPG